jgi:hypothetical protein
VANPPLATPGRFTFPPLVASAGLAMVRVLAVWPGAVRRPRLELAAFVYLVAERADDGNLRQILRPGRVTHATR